MMDQIQSSLLLDKGNWTPVKFGDVVFEPKETARDLLGEGIEHVVGLEHIDSENIHLKRSASIDESTTFSKKFAVGDVLFGRRRAYLKKAAQASFAGICSGDITVFRAKAELSLELLPFVVQNENFFDYAIKHSAGGLSPRVKFKDLANYEFLLPPKAQQSQLAELLWAMDDVIEKHSKLLTQIQKAKRSYFKKFRSASKTKQLSEYATVSYGLGQPPKKDDHGIAMIRATDISRGKISTENFMRISESDIPRGKSVALLEGDIIVVRSGAYTGDLAMVTKECSKAVAGYDLVIKPNRDLINPVWLQEYLLEKEVQEYYKGESIRSAQPHLNSKQVLETRIPVFPISWQNKTCSKLMLFYSSAEKVIKKIADSKALQKSLIAKVFP